MDVRGKPQDDGTKRTTTRRTAPAMIMMQLQMTWPMERVARSGKAKANALWQP